LGKKRKKGEEYGALTFLPPATTAVARREREEGGENDEGRKKEGK